MKDHECEYPAHAHMFVFGCPEAVLPDAREEL